MKRTTLLSILAGGLAAASAAPAAGGAVPLFSDRFDRSRGLVTNEFAYWNPRDPFAAVSRDWEMTSGSLFWRDGAAWSGVPDDRRPDARSRRGTDSCVFRLRTRRGDFGDVAVSFWLRTDRLGATRRTPPVDWDGVHIWLRYQDEHWLYAASINRRDNTVVIKKKVPGGDSNGGTYYVLDSSAPYAVPYKEWQRVEATVRTNPDGTVSLGLYADGRLLVQATDDGVGGPPITRPGRVGIRGDNADFSFKDFSVTALDGRGGGAP